MDNERQRELAAQLMELTRARVMAELRFMTEAIGRLRPAPAQIDAALQTDGETLYYSPAKVLRIFAQQRQALPRALLHTTLHCLLRHAFQRQKKDAALWDLACDTAAEAIIAELDLPLCRVANADTRKAECLRLADYAGGASAEQLYNGFIRGGLPAEEQARLKALFYTDSHALWYPQVSGRAAASGTPQPTAHSGAPGREDEGTAPDRLTPGEQGQTPEAPAAAQRKKQWRRLAKQVEADLKTFNKNHGSRAGLLMMGLKPITFEQVDYSEFLRRFGAKNEVMHLSEDEFDLIYYTYGLERYGNIPLIEPLEYREEQRIRCFVIAIDTSGSVQGDIVQDFLQRTCNVLRQAEAFASRVKILLLQCDAAVQSMTEIEDISRLEEIVPQMNLRGFGGTDFRPVFELIEQKMADKSLPCPDGLIYFTDGVGAYPEREPPYKTAFIFNRDDYISPAVPPWAIRAVLTTDNIKLMKES